jgi:diphosphomevalonate decarboxylase
MNAARAVAHANIALAKYWGKVPGGGNFPCVPSLSMTLDALSTTTSVGFGRGLESDRFVVNGKPATEDEGRRIAGLLDRVREAAEIRTRAWVETANDFPTAAGLASSASGFAALAMAATRAAELPWDLAQVSNLARQSSASAARSVFGGFVTLAAAKEGCEFLAAEPLAEAGDWNVALLVAVASRSAKEVGSTAGMQATAATSPYFASWVEAAPTIYERVKQAVLARDLEALGTAAEESAFAMHACALAARPAVLYWNATTLEVIQGVKELRKGGTLAYVTMDAGPHVKVLCSGAEVGSIAATLREVPGVHEVIVARSGGGASVKPLSQGGPSA